MPPAKLIAHYIRVGAAQGHDPHPLFDTGWYLAENPDVGQAGMNPLAHYLRVGAAQGRDPNPLFDTDWYLAENRDVGQAGMNPLAHYLRMGAGEGRDPNPLFDTDWYLAQNSDVAQAGMNPLAHYLRVGAAEGRAPNPLFYTDWYLAQNPDVARSGMNPLAHYLRVGAGEGRDPNPLFDTDWYLAQNPDVAQAGMNALAHYLRVGATQGRDPNPLFDTDWYLAENPDVAKAGMNPLAHYLRAGVARGRDPNPLFDTDWYLVSNPEVAAAGMNPLMHYLRWGASERRQPSPIFDVDLYLDQLPPGERERCSNPLEHYFVYGRLHDLRATNVFDAKRHPSLCESFKADCANGRPTVLMIVHRMGGGTQTHVDCLTQLICDRVNVLVISPTPDEKIVLSLSAPSRQDKLLFEPRADWEQLLNVLRDCNLSRVHIHHAVENEHYLRAVIDALNVPFDFTVHDYYLLAPQPHLIGHDGRFVGEDLYAHAKELLELSIAPVKPHSLAFWQDEHRWLLAEASRVIVPSHDALRRFQRYYPALEAIVAAHPAIHMEFPSLKSPDDVCSPLRIALIGRIGQYKGLDVLLSCARIAAERALPLTFHVVGTTAPDMSRELSALGVTTTGPYEDTEIPKLLSQCGPHVLWYPSQCPETFSYTLSEGLASGLLVVVGNIGALPERVMGLPRAWIRPWDLAPEEWISFFLDFGRGERSVDTAAAIAGDQAAASDAFYHSEYLDWATRPAPGSGAAS